MHMAKKSEEAMCAAVKVLLGSVVTFLTAMAVLWIFFSDVKPVPWGDVAQSSVRLQTAFFLLTIENLAVFGIVLAAVAILTLWAYPSARHHPEPRRETVNEKCVTK
ncbi:MAG: hypothetical protein WA851_00140 [Xanthobacteraceae bacterium]